MSDLKTWIEGHRIGEVECLVPDMNGVLRGKVVPAAKVSGRDVVDAQLPSAAAAETPALVSCFHLFLDFVRRLTVPANLGVADPLAIEPSTVDGLK